MKDRLYLSFIFSSLFVVGVAMPGPMKAYFRDGNIDISYSVNKEEVKLVASYPKAQAKSVHDYITDHFGLTNLTELSSVEVKNYHTPDKSMNFYIRSRDGYLKIVMSKKTNSEWALEKVRGAAEGIKSILAGN